MKKSLSMCHKMNSKNSKHFTNVEIVFIYSFIHLCSTYKTTEGGQAYYINIFIL